MRRKLLSVALALSFIIHCTLSKSAKAEFDYTTTAMTVGGNVVRLGSAVPDCGSPSAKSEGSILINTYTGEIAFEVPEFVETSSTEYGYYRSRLFIDKCSGVTVEFGGWITNSPASDVNPTVPGTTIWHSRYDIIGHGPALYNMEFNTSNAVDDVYYGNVYGCTTTKLSDFKSAKDGIPTSYRWSFVVITRQTLLDAGVPESLLPDPDPKEKLPQTLTPTLSATTVGYGSSAPTLTVSGAKTALSYASSNTAVATITSGKIAIVGLGSTVFTISAAESSDYKAASATISLTVNKGNITVKVLPTADNLTYGQTLQASKLSGGSAVNGSGSNVAGSWVWKSPTATPNIGKQTFVAKYTPTDTSHYNY